MKLHLRHHLSEDIRSFSQVKILAASLYKRLNMYIKKEYPDSFKTSEDRRQKTIKHVKWEM